MAVVEISARPEASAPARVASRPYVLAPTAAVWLVLVLGLAAVVRFVALGSFPEIEADEGLWTNSAKNFALFGDWFMDGRTHMLLAPAFHALVGALYTILEPGIAVARAVSAAAGVASAWLVFLLIKRLSANDVLALVAATLFAASEWTVLLARRALIEPLQLVWILAAAVVLTRPGNLAAIIAGAVFGVALLTKINAVVMLGILGLAILLGLDGAGQAPFRQRLVRAAAFGIAAVVVAGSVYLALYLRYPVQFERAYLFELNGAHFTMADPVISFGRFGLDPVYAGRTLIGLFREAPFLMVLATLGVASAWAERRREALFFGAWAFLGFAFVLIQLFQPLRYLYFTAPALAYFAALPVVALVRVNGKVEGRRVLAILGVCIAFEMTYLGMNYVANQGVKLSAVREWSVAHLGPDDRVLTAGYLATDLPVRAYAHYYLARTPEELLETVRQYGITWIVYDDDEWADRLLPVLQSHFELAQQWDFGAAYRVVRSPAGEN